MSAGDANVPILERAVRLSSHVVYRSFSLETIVVNLERGVYHGLNPTAGRMLETLEGTSTVREAATRLTEEMGQPRDVIEADLSALCSDLLERGLIEFAP